MNHTPDHTVTLGQRAIYTAVAHNVQAFKLRMMIERIREARRAKRDRLRASTVELMRAMMR
jgi:Rod binding domain-containing protein